MINFEEELTHFKPSLEISEVKDAIDKSEITDMNDILMDILRKEVKEQEAKEQKQDVQQESVPEDIK